MMRIFIDLDDTVTDFRSAFWAAREARPDVAWPQSIPGFFLGLEPLPGAIDALLWLERHPAVEFHILSAPSCRNPGSYSEKRIWVEQHLGYEVVKRFHLSPDKGLFRGDLLIDDHLSGKGQERFVGRVIQFGGADFPDWPAIMAEIGRLLER